DQAKSLASRGIAVHRLYGADEQTSGEESAPFTDCTGKTFNRIPGYRRRIKPGWVGMLARKPGDYPSPNPVEARTSMRAALRRVDLLEKYLSLAGFSLRDKTILEIGCWDGACSAAAVLRGARRCVGIDHQDYFLWNVEPEAITEPMRDAARRSMS